MTDEERDQLRQHLAPIAERIARDLHADYLHDLSFVVIPWAEASDRERGHWRQVAWSVVCRDLTPKHVNGPPLAAD